MSAEENTALIHKEIETLNGHDAAQIEAFMDANIAPDWQYHSPLPGAEPGPAGFKALLAPLLAAFPDGRYTIEDLLAVEDRVMIRWSWSGTHRGEFMGAAPTGKRITTSGIAVTRIAGGKYAETWEQWDLFGFVQQLGATVATPEAATAEWLQSAPAR